MSWIGEIPPDNASGELADTYRQVGDRDGNVENILRVHSVSPAGLRTHYEMYKACMFGRSDLSRKQREMIAVTVSVINRCHY